MANITFSSPFTHSFTHTDVTVGITATQILAQTTNSWDKRVMLIIQNQSPTAVIEVIFSDTGAVGLSIQPNQSIAIENYQGAVRAISTAAATPVHIAFALV